jgi:hypothetical protein
VKEAILARNKDSIPPAFWPPLGVHDDAGAGLSPAGQGWRHRVATRRHRGHGGREDEDDDDEDDGGDDDDDDDDDDDGDDGDDDVGDDDDDDDESMIQKMISWPRMAPSSRHSSPLRTWWARG